MREQFAALVRRLWSERCRSRQSGEPSPEDPLHASAGTSQPDPAASAAVPAASESAPPTAEALHKAKEEAEAANLAKNRFIAGLSHELRTPLNSILGYAQILQRDTSLPPKRRAAADVIHRNGKYLVGLIDGLLDISRIEAGTLRLENVDLRLPEFLQQIVNIFSLQAAEKGLAFDYQAAADLPRVVLIDEKRLSQILINLLGNAVKYTAQGSVRLRVTCAGQVVHFEVSDTGPGIPEEDFNRVFLPFERSWAGQRQADTGTGLGLTICNLLAHMMGGEIGLQSTVGQGSVFTLRLFLPQRDAPSGAWQTTAPITGYQGKPCHVMVVDDQPQQRQLLADMLEPLGFWIRQVPDGAAFLATIGSQDCDIALMDVSMPGMNGFEVVRRAREQGFTQPVIMVSADVSGMSRTPGDTSIAYVPKPVILDTLLARMQDMLQLTWTYASAEAPASCLGQGGLPTGSLPRQDVQVLMELGAIGYVKGIQSHLQGLRQRQPGSAALVDQLARLVDDFRLESFMGALRDIQARMADDAAQETQPHGGAGCPAEPGMDTGGETAAGAGTDTGPTAGLREEPAQDMTKKETT